MGGNVFRKMSGADRGIITTDGKRNARINVVQHSKGHEIQTILEAVAVKDFGKYEKQEAVTVDTA